MRKFGLSAEVQAMIDKYGEDAVRRALDVVLRREMLRAAAGKFNFVPHTAEQGDLERRKN